MICHFFPKASFWISLFSEWYKRACSLTLSPPPRGNGTVGAFSREQTAVFIRELG